MSPLTEETSGCGADPAFPVAITKSNGQGTQFVDHEFGLTKRELFAAMTLQGILSNSGRYSGTAQSVKDAIEHADALLKELAK